MSNLPPLGNLEKIVQEPGIGSLPIYKQFIIAAAGWLAIYFIFSLDLSQPVKNLVLGLACLIAMASVLAVVRIRSGRPLELETLEYAVPITLWVVLLALNALFEWGLPTLVLWATYIPLSVFGYILRAWLEPVEVE